MIDIQAFAKGLYQYSYQQTSRKEKSNTEKIYPVGLMNLVLILKL